MKKVLVLFIAFFTLFLIGCDNQETTDMKAYVDSQVAEIQADLVEIASDIQQGDLDIAVLEEQIALLNERIDNLKYFVGLNGIPSFFENESYLNQLSDTVTLLKGELDGDKVPSYMVDAEGNYVSMEDLGLLFKQKYFGVYGNPEDIYSLGYLSHFQMKFITELSNEEILARTMLMINELRNYEFYIIGSCQLLMGIYPENNGYTHSLTIKIPMQVMLNDAFTIDIQGMYDGNYDIYFNLDGNINITQAISIYNDYVANGTFDGYVLDF